MADQMPEINQLRYGEPTVKDGELVVPLKFRQQTAHGPHTINIYLTAEKLAALERGSAEALEDLEAVVDA